LIRVGRSITPPGITDRVVCRTQRTGKRRGGHIIRRTDNLPVLRIGERRHRPMLESDDANAARASLTSVLALPGRSCLHLARSTAGRVTLPRTLQTLAEAVSQESHQEARHAAPLDALV